MFIKNIILDLGGVILDVSYENTASAFKKLGIKNFVEVYSQKKQEHFFDNYEKGFISDDEFRNEIRSSFSTHISNSQIDDAWNSLILTMPEERYIFLKGLKKNYKLFLLSNTNNIHIKCFTALFENYFGKNVFENLFEKMYLSCLLKMRKPDAEIFYLVMNENNLDYSQTIFIDDSIQHVEGARKAGITSFLLDAKQTTLEKFFPRILTTA